jgi:cob(I)alamin adenosyltransferase
LAKIYTRTGDKGETGLFSSVRISKDSPRVRAYGDIDELNSVLGLIRTSSKNEEMDLVLEGLQKDLFVAGADLASPTDETHDIPRITEEMVERLEKTIDMFQEMLPALKVFILPGGGETGALLHFARSITRRTERSIVSLSKIEEVNENLVPYFNRLSDLLFVMARSVNHQEGQDEDEWHRSK